MCSSALSGGYRSPTQNAKILTHSESEHVHDHDIINNYVIVLTTLLQL